MDSSAGEFRIMDSHERLCALPIGGWEHEGSAEINQRGRVVSHQIKCLVAR